MIFESIDAWNMSIDISDVESCYFFSVFDLSIKRNRRFHHLTTKIILVKHFADLIIHLIHIE